MQADVIKVITDIEQAFDTSRLLYRGVSYWPICRQRLWGGLMRKVIAAREGADPTPVANTGPQWADVAQVNVATVGPQELGLLTATPARPAQLAPQVLFFARPEEYSDKVAGKAYARFIDSVFAQAAAAGPVTKIELADARVMGFTRRHPSLFLDLARAAQDVAFDPPGQLEGFADLAAAAAPHAEGLLNEGSILTDMGKIFYFARIFEKILRALKPRLFVLSVSYHPVGNAWMLACRRAGVRSVDLQHGRLGPIHGNYTHLTAAPPDGYDLLPDHVWCWGEPTKRDIAAHNNPRCARHTGIVGGNAWLARWRHGDLKELEPPEAAAFVNATQGKRKILVSLQPLDTPLTATMIGAMKASPPDWLWLLRLHPLRRHTAPDIKARLEAAGVMNFEIENATTLPLYLLLRLCAHHVTVFSSVVTEAASFDVRTSLLDDIGASTFASYVARGICRLTPTAEALVAHVQECLATERKPLNDDFVDMRPDTASRALADLLA